MAALPRPGAEEGPALTAHGRSVGRRRLTRNALDRSQRAAHRPDVDTGLPEVAAISRVAHEQGGAPLRLGGAVDPHRPDDGLEVQLGRRPGWLTIVSFLPCCATRPFRDPSI